MCRIGAGGDHTAAAVTIVVGQCIRVGVVVVDAVRPDDVRYVAFSVQRRIPPVTPDRRSARTAAALGADVLVPEA